MQINVNNPKFLLDTLKIEVVHRTRYLVEQGIAYDADWRNGFVELFKLIDELERRMPPMGDKLESPQEMVDGNNAKKQATRLNASQHVNMANYPKGTKVLLGKGKTIWTVVGHSGHDFYLERAGAGRNKMTVQKGIRALSEEELRDVVVKPLV